MKAQGITFAKKKKHVQRLNKTSKGRMAGTCK